MCGLNGIINFNGQSVDKTSLTTMMKTMKHRGPDDEGVFIDGNIGFGFVRLSIIDLSIDGHQPMCNLEERYTIVFNGEIYNYIELKKELSTEYKFRTQTDTEVILFAFEKWGKECLNRLNGMFAFAIYDNVNKTVFLARDRFGIKPLYYYSDSQRFIFSSEIKPILAAAEKFYKPQPNDQIIYDFLVYNRTNHTSQTFFKDIFKLQHGHTIYIKNNEICIEKWYDLNSKVKEISNVNTDEFKDLFKSSIELRLRSDVPVGACLSGGLDSSAIVSTIIKNFEKADLNTFSAIYEKGDKGDESEFINIYNGLVKNMHFTKPDYIDLLKNLDAYITALEEPIPGTSEYAEFKVYQMAKDYTTVILNGQGADEALAGYLYFAGFYYKELFKKLRWKKLLSEIYNDIKNHKSYQGPISFIYFMLPILIKDFASKKATGYLENKFASEHRGESSFLKNLYGAPTLKKSLINHFEYKFEHHLIWADKSSMWFSLESRYPFLDYRLVEYMLSLPVDYVLNKGVTKVILREAMKDIVPEKIRLRMDKVGYETPEDKWFRQPEMKAFILNILDSDSFKNRGYINAEKAKKLYELHLLGKKNISTDIWKWIHLELWFRKFIDN